MLCAAYVPSNLEHQPAAKRWSAAEAVTVGHDHMIRGIQHSFNYLAQ
jgi:hypothetical protein